MHLDNVKNYIFFWGIGALLILSWYLKDILFILFTGLVFGIAIQEWSNYLTKKLKLPFTVVVSLIYLILVIMFIVSLYSIAPIILEEIKALLPNLYDYLDSFGLKNIKKYLGATFSQPTPELIRIIFTNFLNIIGGIFNFILILVISFYVATQSKFIDNFFARTLNNERFIKIYFKIKKRFSLWLISQLFLMTTIGIATLILLLIFKVPYAGLLALIAGLTEIIPIIGPIIAGSIGVIVAFTYDPNIVLWVIAGFILIQQAENNLLVPLVAKYALNIPPIFTLCGILIGAKIGGILGVISVLPLLIIGIEIFEEMK